MRVFLKIISNLQKEFARLNNYSNKVLGTRGMESDQSKIVSIKELFIQLCLSMAIEKQWVKSNKEILNSKKQHDMTPSLENLLSIDDIKDNVWNIYHSYQEITYFIVSSHSNTTFQLFSLGLSSALQELRFASQFSFSSLCFLGLWGNLQTYWVFWSFLTWFHRPKSFQLKLCWYQIWSDCSR